ncbi:hypothetical protein [Parafilimonas sp.]|uniref:hypothetical protein n=1 Tax=Parafilimonas sp. TaxID=1969739 RepID=UPI0039E4A12F
MTSKKYWEGELFSSFGYIEIRYHKSDTSNAFKRFFFTKGKLSIFVAPSQDEQEVFSIDEKSSENLIPYSKMDGDLLDSFIKKEDDKVLNFFHANRAQFDANPRLIHETFLLSDSIIYKKNEFIKQHPDTFLAF